jgi:hypothetical protein
MDAEGLFIRLYLDEMVPGWFAAALREVGIDAESTGEAEMGGASDEEQLIHAVDAGRALFSCNVADPRHNMGQIHAEWMNLGRTHRGIILCPQERVSRDASEVLRRLLQFLDTTSADEIARQLVWLP